jgi:hypothetical protein
MAKSSNDMKEYIKLEARHFFSEEAVSIKPLREVELTIEFEGTENLMAKIGVHEVTLQSGAKYFATEGGWGPKSMRYMQGMELPDPETAAKRHVVTMIAMMARQNPNLEGFAEEIADYLELPEQFRGLKKL